MICACIRTTMLAAPLIVGALGCTTSTVWFPSSNRGEVGSETGLSTESLMAIGRMLERQGRTVQAQRVYASVASRDATHDEAARRLELLAANERKLRGREPSQQIAKRVEETGQPVVGVAELSSGNDSPVYEVCEVIVLPSSHDQPATALQPSANDISIAVVTSDATSNSGQDFLVEVVATADEELRQLVGKLNELRPLVQKLKDDDPAVRKEAVANLALRGAEAKPALPALAKRLADDDAGVRVRAARAIWEIDRDDQQVIPALSELVGDPQAVVCCMSAFLLGEIGPKAAEALPGLRRVLPHANAVVRVHVAEAIARIDPKDRNARGVLVESLGDVDSDVRWLAACALESAASENDLRVVDGLTAALRDCDPRVRSTAALTLIAFGPSAKRAVPSLRNALNESDARVREAAAIALANIDPESATGNE